MALKSTARDVVLVIFEGPDMSGKTTTMNGVKEYLLQNIAGRNSNLWCGKSPTFKFPVYDSVLGSSILTHLKYFKPRIVQEKFLGIEYESEKENIDRIMKSIIDFSSMQCVNKAANLSSLLDLFSYDDIVLCDRAFLSQYIYDIAWLKFYKTGNYFTDKGYEESFKRFALSNALMIETALFELAEKKGLNLHIITEFFVGNDPIIEHVLSEAKHIGRRVDSYDTMVEYKKSVSEEFLRIIKTNDSTDDEKFLIKNPEYEYNMQYHINSVTKSYLEAAGKKNVDFETDKDKVTELIKNEFNDVINNVAKEKMRKNIVKDILKVLEYDPKDFIKE